MKSQSFEKDRFLMNKIGHTKLLILLATLLVLLIPVSLAKANSLPPPYRIYFRFIDTNERSIPVESVQVAGCEDADCKSPQYLIGYGICQGAHCLTGERALPDSWKLQCAGNRCILENPVNFALELPAYLQLRMEGGKEEWQSEPFATPDCDYCDTWFKVILSSEMSKVEADSNSTVAGAMQMNFWPSWLVTILVECLASIGITEFWKRRSPGNQLTIWKGVLLANILSYPVAWVTIPSLGQMQQSSATLSGLVIFFTSLVIAAAALFIAANRGKMRGWMIITGIVLIPVCAALVLAALFLSSYGNYDVNISGLSPAVVIITAELYAVGFEALFLWLLKKKTMLFRQALLISAVLNLLSAGIGFLLFR
jgi:hypothetical protein